MKNIDVVNKFLRCECASGSNLNSSGDRLFSYNTCIAQWLDDILYLNMTQYSPTSSKHRNMIVNKYQGCIVRILNVPINSHSLCRTRKQM